jgi:hypothetical protein
MTLVELIVFGLATWRISSMLVDEPGPFRMFIKLRGMFGITHDMDDNVLVVPDGFMPGVLSCIWCTSVWVGLFMTLFYFVPYSFFVALPLALSAVAIKFASSGSFLNK